MKTYVNLMPMRYRRGQLVRRRLKQWAVVWLLASFATALLAWNHWSQYQAGVAKLESLQSRYEPIKKMKNNVVATKEKIDDLQRRESLALSLSDERSMLGLVGLLSQARNSCDGRVSIGNLSLVRNGTSQSATSVLTLTGVAADDLAVAQFASALRDANAFNDVELKSTGTKTFGERNARTYTMECTF